MQQCGDKYYWKVSKRPAAVHTELVGSNHVALDCIVIIIIIIYWA